MNLTFDYRTVGFLVRLRYIRLPQETGIIFDDSQRGLHLVGNIGQKLLLQALHRLNLTSDFIQHVLKINQLTHRGISPVGMNPCGKIPAGNLASRQSNLVHRTVKGHVLYGHGDYGEHEAEDKDVGEGSGGTPPDEFLRQRSALEKKHDATGEDEGNHQEDEHIAHQGKRHRARQWGTAVCTATH